MKIKKLWEKKSAVPRCRFNLIYSFKAWKSTLTHDRLRIRRGTKGTLCFFISLSFFPRSFSPSFYPHLSFSMRPPVRVHGTHHTLKVARVLKGAGRTVWGCVLRVSRFHRTDKCQRISVLPTEERQRWCIRCLIKAARLEEWRLE